MRCHDVPEPTIVPFAAAVDDGLIAMQDNLCLSAARVSLDITEEDTNIMDWSASTQDLNLIEYCWDVVGRHVGEHKHPIRTVNDLGMALLENL